MTLRDQLDALLDATAFDSTGTKIGAVRQVYVDDATGKATFATVATGIFSSDAIVPLHGARLLDGELHVDHIRSAVRESPRPDHTEDALTPGQESDILEHYGIEPRTPDDVTTGVTTPRTPERREPAKTPTIPPAAAPTRSTPGNPTGTGTEETS